MSDGINEDRLADMEQAAKYDPAHRWQDMVLALVAEIRVQRANAEGWQETSEGWRQRAEAAGAAEQRVAELEADRADVYECSMKWQERAHEQAEAIREAARLLGEFREMVGMETDLPGFYYESEAWLATHAPDEQPQEDALAQRQAARIATLEALLRRAAPLLREADWTDCEDSCSADNDDWQPCGHCDGCRLEGDLMRAGFVPGKPAQPCTDGGESGSLQA